MIPFRLTFRPGLPLSEQVVYAATRAIVAGQLAPGDPFPSVRALSRELKINPNTAHKVVMALTAEGFLAVKPGVGTVVAQPPAGSAVDRTSLLKGDVERLVVEANRLGLTEELVVSAVRKHWRKLTSTS